MKSGAALRLLWAWLCCASTLWLCSVVHAQSGYAGKYLASPAQIEAAVTVWGPDCGPKPQSYTMGERPTVEVRDQGAHLAIVFPDHTLRTSGCWSPNPTVRVTSATAADNRWRTECRTPEGEAKRESGRYTVSAESPFTLELLEESDYDWQLNQSHCVAKVRIKQVLERASSERPAPAPTSAPSAESPQPEAPLPTCVAGTLTRIRLRPSEARIAPGQRLCFTVRGFDASGCATDVDGTTLSWDLKKPSAAKGTLAGGCFKAAESAAEAEGIFRVTAVSSQLRTEASVTVAAPDLSDITARRGATGPRELGPSGQARGTGVAGAGVRAVGVEGPPQGLFIGLAAFIVLTGIGLAVWIMRRNSARVVSERVSAPGAARRAPESSAPAPMQLAAASAPTPPVAAPSPAPAQAVSSDEQWICPSCRRGYAPGTLRCEADGTAPIPYSEFVRRAKAAEVAVAACPACGSKLAPGAVFCGVCGKRLGT